MLGLTSKEASSNLRCTRSCPAVGRTSREASSRDMSETCSGTPASSLFKLSTTRPQSSTGLSEAPPVGWNSQSWNSFSRYLSPATQHHPRQQAATCLAYRFQGMKVHRGLGEAGCMH